jgi:hypothetical protein
MADYSQMSTQQLLALYKQEQAKQGVGGFANAANTTEYMKQIAKNRANSDMKRLEAAQATEQQAYENEATALGAEQVLKNTPTGLFADQRVGLGKALGGTFIGGHLGIPNTEQTANMETIKRLGNTGVLGQVGQLKGPLSDRDVSFVQSLNYSPEASKLDNQRMVETQKWVARRQAAYAASLSRWTELLGSPSATNAQGMTFDRFWGDYSAKALPRPDLARAMTAGKTQVPQRASAGPVKISGDADYNRLPSGAVFIGPDGVKRKKP